MKKRLYFIVTITTLTIAIVFGNWVQSTSAHGTDINYKLTTAVEIEALFDTGEPMADAQVIVYAPDDPEQPWLKGQADDQGRFVFAPDPSISGRWDVSIRTAGHGEIVYIPVNEGDITVVASGGPNTLQTVIMSLAGLWGFVGTALFFSRRK